MESTKKTNIIFNTMAILLIIIFAFTVSQKTLQNDTFYTIKIGEYIVNNGITMQDPFSWHDLSYTFPHWAYDVMIYLIYSIGGHLGIYISTIVFSSILGLLMFLINDKFTNNKSVSFVLTIGALFLLKDFIAARAQLFTFILFAIELLCIEGFLETSKKRYVFGLLIVPVLIANFHVAVFPFYFVLYLPYIAEYIIYCMFDIKGIIEKKIKKINKMITKTTDEQKLEKLNNRLEQLTKKQQNYKSKKSYKILISKKENTKALIIIMIVCLFTGLLSPLGLTPYTYLVKTLQGNSTSNISEHLPLTLANNVVYACVLILFITILTFTDTKIRLCDLFMLGGLTVLTFMSRRQESMFIIMCVPIFNRLVTSFLRKYDKEGIEQMKILMTTICGIIVTTCIVLILSAMAYKNKYKDDYISKSSYPVEASEWILNNLNLDEIKIYNGYNYGSYLLFKGIPVFVDSRCDLYLPEFNNDVHVFDDFLTISGLGTKKLEERFDKYGFTHFVVYANEKLTIYLDAKSDIYNKIYNDDNFAIYERVLNVGDLIEE